MGILVLSLTNVKCSGNGKHAKIKIKIDSNWTSGTYIANTPSYCTFTSWWRLISLTFDAKIHNMVSANATVRFLIASLIVCHVLLIKSNSVKKYWNFFPLNEMRIFSFFRKWENERSNSEEKESIFLKKSLGISKTISTFKEIYLFLNTIWNGN